MEMICLFGEVVFVNVMHRRTYPSLGVDREVQHRVRRCSAYSSVSVLTESAAQ